MVPPRSTCSLVPDKITAEPSVVIPLPEPERARLLKRMSIITRLPELSEEDFRREWKTHGD